MADKKLTAEEFVRRVLAQSFGQNVDKETVLEVAKKVRQAVATNQKPPRNQKAA
jgi:hypothetical protein